MGEFLRVTLIVSYVLCLISYTINCFFFNLTKVRRFFLKMYPTDVCTSPMFVSPTFVLVPYLVYVFPWWRMGFLREGFFRSFPVNFDNIIYIIYIYIIKLFANIYMSICRLWLAKRLDQIGWILLREPRGTLGVTLEKGFFFKMDIEEKNFTGNAWHFS